jgi:rhodanese-related sulfurtransferase
MDIQRVRVKLFAEAPEDLDVAPLLDIFSRWRHDGDHPARWIDLADYAHVPDGPLAMLVGKQGNLLYDLEDGRPGLVWRNKTALEGDAERRVETALRRGLALFSALAREEGFPDALRLDTAKLAVEFVDRLEAPNDDASDQALGPAVRAALDKLYGRGQYSATRRDEAHRALGYEAQAWSARALDELVARLEALDDLDRDEVGVEVEGMEIKRVGAKEAALLMENDGYAYIDVRSLGEFAAGHPEGAYNVPILIEGPSGYSLVPNPDFVEVMQAHFPKDAKLVLGCRSGGRSLRAAQILVANGYTDVIDNFAGYEAGQGPRGVELGWGRSGLPTAEEAEPGRSWQELRAAQDADA